MTEPLLDVGTLSDLNAVAASSRVGAIADGSHTCIIITPATSSANGSPTRGTPSSQSVPCLFWTAGGDESSDDALAQRGRYRIDIDAATEIDHSCTVFYQGTTYRVLWAPPPHEAGRIVGLTEGGAVTIDAGLLDSGGHPLLDG